MASVLVLLLGMSFERESDWVRIEAILQTFKNVKVLTANEIKFPTCNATKYLGRLSKFYPDRYEHLECEFLELRGIKKIKRKIQTLALPSEGYLDYQWLQDNYYKERYGMNWILKITILIQEAKMINFFLPNDKSRNINQMIDLFDMSKFSKNIYIYSVSAHKCFEVIPLVASDLKIKETLCSLGREPERQVQLFLDFEESFFVFSSTIFASSFEIPYSIIFPKIEENSFMSSTSCKNNRGFRSLLQENEDAIPIPSSKKFKAIEEKMHGFSMQAKLLESLLMTIKESDLHQMINFLSKSSSKTYYVQELCVHQELREQVRSFISSQSGLEDIVIDTETVLTLSKKFIESFVVTTRILKSAIESFKENERKHRERMYKLRMLIPSSRRIFYILELLKKHPVHENKLFTLSDKCRHELELFQSSNIYDLKAESWTMENSVERGNQILDLLDQLTKYNFWLYPVPNKSLKYFEHIESTNEEYPYTQKVADRTLGKTCSYCSSDLNRDAYGSPRKAAALILLALAKTT